MAEKIQLKGREFIVEEPTLKQLRDIKDLLGHDIISGLSSEQLDKMLSDPKIISQLMAILITEIDQSRTAIESKAVVVAEKDINELSEFFYQHGTLRIFKEVLSFFTSALREALGIGGAKPVAVAAADKTTAVKAKVK